MWVPWSPQDSSRHIRSDLPTIGDVWQSIRSWCENLESDRPLDDEALSQLLEVDPVLWRQWVHRAKEWTKEILGPEQWYESFGFFMG